MFRLLYIFTLLFSVNSFAAITATDPDNNDFTVELALNQSSQMSVQLDAADGDEIVETRIYGSGISLSQECLQVFNSPNLSCVSVIDIAASTQGSKRVEYRTAEGQRLRVTLRINRTASDPVDPTSYSTALSANPSSIDFGLVDNDSVYQTIYITNTSPNPTETLAPITFSSQGYSLLSNTCSGRVLGGGNNCRIVVNFDARGLFGGTYQDSVKINPVSDNSSPLEIPLTVNVPTQPQATLEVDTGFSKVDPTACLALAGINPSECYYEADLPTSGSTTVGSVSCVGTPSQCSVVINKKLANEPVEFIITVNYEDQPVQAIDPADFSHTVAPATTSFGEILIGNSSTQTLTITNTSAEALPLPINITLSGTHTSEASLKNNTCSSLSVPLAVGATCKVDVKITPTVVHASSTITATVDALGNLETAQITYSSRDPNVQFLDVVTSSISTNKSVYTIGQDTISFTFNAIGDLGNPMDVSGTLTANFANTNFPLSKVSKGVYTGGPYPFNGFTSGQHTVKVFKNGADLGLAGTQITARTDVEYVDPVASSLVLDKSIYTIDQDTISFTFNSINDDGQPYDLTSGSVVARIGSTDYTLTKTGTGVYTAGPTAVSGFTSGSYTAEVFKDGVSVGVSQSLTLRTELEYLDPIASSIVPDKSTYIVDEGDTISVVFNSVNDDGQPYDFSGTFSTSLGSISIPLTKTGTGVYSGGPVAVAGISTGTYTLEVLRNGLGTGVQAQVEIETAVQLSSFGPRYPNGTNWNYWVNKTNLAACSLTFDSKFNAVNIPCYHGGEAKKVEVSNADCSIHTIEDSLGAFDWSCDDSGSPTVYYSQLREDKNLSDLIDFSNNTFKQNDIVLKENGTEIERNTNPVWWTNPIESAPTQVDVAHNLTDQGKIYTVNQSLFDISGYHISADNVSFVVNPGNTLTVRWWQSPGEGVYDYSTYEFPSNGTGGNAAVSSANNKYLWVEAGDVTINDPSRQLTSGFYGLHFYQNQYLVIRNTAVHGFSQRSFTINRSKFVSIHNVDVYDNYNTYNAPTQRGWGLELPSAQEVLITKSRFWNNHEAAITDSGGSASAVLVKDSLVAGSGASNTATNGPANFQYNGSNLYIENSRIFGGFRFNSDSSPGNINITRSYMVGGAFVGTNGGSFIANTMPHASRVVGYNGVKFYNIITGGGGGFEIRDGTTIGRTLGDLTNVFNSPSAANNNNPVSLIILGFTVEPTYVGPLIFDPNSCLNYTQDEIIDIGNGTCSSSTASITFSNQYNFSNSFVGAVADTQNSSDNASGYLSSMNRNTIDWENFENDSRVWGYATDIFATQSFSSSPCLDGMSCQIIDYSLKSTDTLFKNHYTAETFPSVAGQACPAAVNGDQTEFAHDGGEFLVAAVEIISDDLGDNDGLCEASEACVFMPNHGAYQGHGDLVECSYNPNGGLTGIKMYGYPINGR